MSSKCLIFILSHLLWLKKYKKYMASLLKCYNFYVSILEEICNSCNFVILQEVFLEHTAGMVFSIRILKQENINLMSLFLLMLFQTLCLPLIQSLYIWTHTQRNTHKKSQKCSIPLGGWRNLFSRETWTAMLKSQGSLSSDAVLPAMTILYTNKYYPHLLHVSARLYIFYSK